MQSKNIDYDPRLDHLRALAAITVVMFHAKLAIIDRASAGKDLFPIPWIDQGHVGVALFMVISGFIFSRIANRGEINVARFYVSRALRIYPLMIVLTALACSVNHKSAVQFLALLLPWPSQFPWEVAPLWSVGLELQFYLIFPFLYSELRRSGWRGYVALFGLLLGIRLVVFLIAGTVHHVAYFTMFGALDAFVFGFVAEKLATRWKPPAFAPFLIFALFCAVLLVAFRDRFYHIDYAHPQALYTESSSRIWIVWPTIQAALCAMLVASYMACQINFPGSRFLAGMGTISFSIYGWQNFVLVPLAAHIHGLSPYVFGLVAAVALLPVAWLSYRVIERPFLNRRVRYLRPRMETKQTKLATD